MLLIASGSLKHSIAFVVFESQCPSTFTFFFWISVPQYIYFFFLNLSAWGTGALRFKDHKGNWVFQGATGYQQHRIHVLGHWDSKTTKAIQRYLFSWISVPKYRYFTLQSHSVESQCPSTFTLQSHCTTNASTCLVRCRSWDSTVV